MVDGWVHQLAYWLICFLWDLRWAGLKLERDFTCEGYQEVIYLLDRVGTGWDWNRNRDLERMAMGARAYTSVALRGIWDMIPMEYCVVRG